MNNYFFKQFTILHKKVYHMKFNIVLKSFLLFILISIIGCNNNPFKNNRNISNATGWKISTKDGGYKNNKSFKGQQTGPGLVFVEGGTFTKGNVKDNVMHDWNNSPTQQYVRSFFIDETEVTNSMYVEYLFWMNKVFAKDYPNIYKAALPDTLVWRNPLGFNEDMVNNYLRHPAFENHPVVGVSWKQATNFAKWRTDRVNERILVENGYLRPESIHPDSLANGYSFNTKAYFLNPGESFGGKIYEMADSKQTETNENGETVYNNVKRESGLLLPEYRLPTETEWEYAALALSEISEMNLYRGKKKFPWSGEYTRSGKRKNQGDQLANFKLSDGDYGGIAGWSESGSGITSSVKSYPANDFGIYGMAGNVAEWVADVYRPIIDEEMNDISYYRGNQYFNPSIGEDGKVLITKNTDSISTQNLPGSIQYEDSNSVDLRNFNDGDLKSTREFLSSSGISQMYNSPDLNDPNSESTTLISDKARVYKGGSWLDRAYYLDPAQRRYQLESMTSNFIGFRCAMSYLGEVRNTKKSRKR